MKKYTTILLLAVFTLALIAPSLVPVAHATTTPNNVLNNGTIGNGGNQGTIGGGGNQGTVGNKPIPKLTNPLKEDSVEKILLLVVDLAMNIGIVAAVIMIIYAGFRFIWARGNPSELEEAKHLFMYVIIGLAVLIAAKAIVGIVKNTLIQANVVDEKVFNKPN